MIKKPALHNEVNWSHSGGILGEFDPSDGYLNACII